MALLLAIQFLSLQAEAARASPAANASSVVERVQDSSLHVRMEIPGFTTEDRTAKIIKNVLGSRAVIVGAMPEKLASLEVIADKETEEHLTDEKWRDHNLLGSGSDWKLFDTAGMACCEISVMMDGSGSHDFHAFTVRANHRIDVHVAESLTATRKPELAREDFAKLIGTFRLGVVRRGTWDQMPAAALDLMSSAFQHGAEWKPWLEERAKADPEDTAALFAAAELARYFESPPAEQVTAYQGAIGRLEKKKDPSPPEKLAHATCEDGMALALIDSGDVEKSISHFERALEIAKPLTAPVRADIAYSLARAHARLGHVELAVARIVESEDLATGALVRALKDKEFDPIRGTERFQALLIGGR